MLVNVVAGMIWVGISAYAVFGGADFGAGIWDLQAGGPQKGRRVRSLIERSIGPVWEANHVWLIFVLVYLWTAFPEPFVSIATTMWIPLVLAAMGIIFRGAGFAFRKWADTTAKARVYGAAFAGASFLTPFFLGTVAGGVASGRIPLGNTEGNVWSSWLNPTSLLGGVMAIVACAYVAAVLLTRDAAADRSTDLTDYFRARALVTGLAAGVVALIGVWIIRVDAPRLYDGLISVGGEILVITSAIGGLMSMWLLWRRHYVAARPFAVLAVVSVLWGWGAGQYPWVLQQEATAQDYAAPDPVLWALVFTFVAASVLAIPSLVALYRLTQTGKLGDTGGVRPDSTQAFYDSLKETDDVAANPSPHRASLVDYLHWQANACRELGSPFYGTLVDGLADDVKAGGPIATALRGFEDDPKDTAVALRLLGTVHRMVLSDRAPVLSSHYPSVGGDGDAATAIGKFVSVVEDRVDQVRSGLTQAPQTNEVGRSAPLFGALLHLSPDRPVRLFELGASAGLNLHGDQYRYLAADGFSWGPESSELVMADAWDRVPWRGRPEIIERRGTDVAPVDITTEDGALTLTSYVWPDQRDRLQRLRDAIGIARRHGIEVERSGVADFLRHIELVDGTLTVVWHSVMWQYVAPSEQEAADRELRRLLEHSDATAGFAHISFEPYRADPDEPLVFSVAYEDGTGLHCIGEAAPHGIPTRWY